MIYPNTGRDLFAEPESYAYAKCAGEDFLDEWKASRTAAMESLAARATESAVEDGTMHDAPPADAIALHSLLLKVPASVAVLEPWFVKFEVFGRLFEWYRDDGRRHPDSSTARPSTYILFAQRLCDIAEESRSLKFLSILLKICDALASQPVTVFRPSEAAELSALLVRESSLVTKLIEPE